MKEYFDSVAVKVLSAVETKPEKSNQHEINGVGKLKFMLGNDYQKFQTDFLYLSDDEENNISDKGFLTWYDARKDHPTRSEFRLYFSPNDAMRMASENDLLITGKKGQSLFIIIAESGSTIASQLCWLFDVDDIKGLSVKNIDGKSEKKLDYVTSMILEKLGFNTDEALSDENYLEDLIRLFPDGFPSTKIFSSYARKSYGEIDLNDSDKTILGWMGHEEMLFRTYEKYLVRERLLQGFGEDVDSFVKYSLSIQNRRKSRVGHAFENHLEEIFIRQSIKYQRGARTENKSKPDFLFPGGDEYHDVDFPVELLTMLGVKTTCKDRWRQILSEAGKINIKHLATLEPSISINQTEEMKDRNVRLVVPNQIQFTYTDIQRTDILTFNEFLTLLLERQVNKE